MGKKPYIKPEIREESQILTVRAWVTTTQYLLTEPTTETSLALQTFTENVSQTTQSSQEVLSETSYWSQQLIARIFSRGRA